MRTAIYPGSFDPVTLGHLDILERACERFDRVLIAVMENNAKTGLFTPEERADQIRHVIGHLSNAEVMIGSGLTVEFARSLGATTIIRGLRAVTDFEYELQQAAINMTLAPEVETVFFMAKPKYSFLSSSAAKTVAYYGGDLSPFVPDYVAEKLKEKYGGSL